MSASRLEALLSERDHLMAEKSKIQPGIRAPQVEQSTPSAKLQSLIAERDRLLAEKSTQRQTANNEPWTIGQRALQAAHGVGSTYENLADMIPKGAAGALVATDPRSYGLPSTASQEQQRSREEAIGYLNKPHAKGIVTDRISNLAGRELNPTEGDKLGKFIHTAGEFASPLPGSGLIAAGKAGIKPLASQLGKEVATATGASGALNLTPSMTEEGTLGRVGEDIGKIVLFGKLGRGLADNVKNLPAKAMAFRANPNERVFKLAEKHKIELPFNVGMGSTPSNFIANNYLKSMFSSDRYKKVFTKATGKMLDKVKNSINSLGSSELKPSEASGEFRQAMKEEEKLLSAEARNKYDEASKLLTENDLVVPENTIQSLKGASEILNRDITAPATKKVGKVLSDLMEAWGLSPKVPKTSSGEFDTKKLAALLQKTSMSKPIEVSRLDAVRKELNSMVDYDPEVKGMEAFLSRLVRDLEKDINLSSNKSYLAKRKEANTFFKSNIADRFRTSMAESVLRNEAPTEAFNLMTNAQRVRDLEKIAGTSEKSKEVFNALKKAKLRQIFEGAIEDEAIRSAPFSKLFSKKEGRQELIEVLLNDKKSYNDLSEIAEIANSFSESGRELLNTSGTALAHSDITRAEQLVKTTLGTFFGAGAGFSAAGLPGAAIGAGMPYVLSQAVSNPKWVRQARMYAIARQKGNEKYANTLLNGLVKMTKPSVQDAKNAGLWTITKNDKGIPVVTQNPREKREGEKK
jgi:hypothetical protein